MSTIHSDDTVTAGALQPAAADVPGGPPASTRSSRRNRPVIALAAVIALLLAAGSVLTVLLVSERDAAAQSALLDARADREHEEAVAEVVAQREDVEGRIGDAEARARAAQGRIDTAEAERKAAEEEISAREQAAAEAIAADEQSFVDLMVDDMPGVPHAELVTRGRDVCAYLDSTGGDVYTAIDRAAASYGDDAAIPLVAAAVVMFCPEHD